MLFKVRKNLIWSKGSSFKKHSLEIEYPLYAIISSKKFTNFLSHDSG